MGAAARPRSNVPASLTRLVGRDAAVADVVERVADGRLVTLTGPGGVGKTRLALAAADRLAGPAGDGQGFDAVWVVELAGREAAATAGRAAGGDGGRDRLAEHVAAVLGVRDEAAPHAGTGTADQLARALADRRVLLVLDNCEHLLAPVAALARVLLGAAPGLRILATSREPLSVPGELVRPVPPLDLPGTGEVTEASAVQLFVERAAAAAPGFALDGGTAPAVATICRRLDGLPLALELAAARVRGLGVEALAERLDRRFDLLAAGDGWTPARHRTLRAVIDWSWDLLGPGEQAVLRRVAVHADGLTLDAAEAVGAGEANRAGGPDAGAGGVTPDQVPGLLARLVDRSLVVAEDTPAGVRYRLLETIAEYARERLADAGETGSAHHRHATHHVELAERADAEIRTHDQRRWLDRLDAEAANVRAAGEWAVERGDAALALRLAGAMAWYWYLRGRHREGHRTLGAALALAAATGAGAGAGHTPARAHATVWRSVLGLLLLLEDDRAAMWRTVLRSYDEPGVDDERGRARAEWILALVLFETDESPSAGPLAERALERFRRHGDRWGTAAALNVLGWAAVGRSDLAEARRRGEESLALFRELGDRWGRVRADDLLGVLAEVDGDLDRAAEHHRDGLRHAEEIGLWPAVADHLGRLGRLALLRGDYAEADALNHRSLRLASDLGFEHGVVFAEIGLGLSARRQGRLDDAERHLRRGVESHRADGFRPAMAFVLAQLGFVAELRGDEAAARAWHGEGLAAARASGDARSVALAFEGLAGVAVLGGDAAAGARLLGAAGAVRDAAGAPLPGVERADVDRIEQAARAALGDAGFAAAFRDGEAQGPDAEP